MAPGRALVGVDLGGTKTEVLVLDAHGQAVFRQRQPTPSHDYPALLAATVDLVAQAKAATGLPEDTPVGMGMPGCLDPHTQTVRGANTQCLNGRPFAQDLRAASHCDWVLENDANCLILSEATDGAAAGAILAFGVILGTGCGGGWAWRGQVWAGLHGLAGEWGHNPLPWPSPEELATPACWCGQTGCLETWLSGPGASADHQRRTGQALTMTEWVQAMRAGAPEAVRSWQAYVDRLARALAQVINQSDPDVIVLGGGLSQITELYEQVPAQWHRYGFHRPLRTPLRPAQHGDSSGIRGAAWLSTQAPTTAAQSRAT